MKQASYALLLSVALGFGLNYHYGDAFFKVFSILKEKPEQLTQRLAYTDWDIKLTIVPPKYTGEGPSFIEGGSGEFEALKGSQVTIEAVLSRQAQNAKIWFKYPNLIQLDNEGDTAIKVDGQADPVPDEVLDHNGDLKDNKPKPKEFLEFDLKQRRVKVSFQLEHGLKWNVSLVDREGTVWREAVERNVRLKFDQVPSVKVINPISGERVDPAKDLKVTLEAKDDFGLKSASIFVALASDMEHPEELALNGVKGKKWRATTWSI